MNLYQKYRLLIRTEERDKRLEKHALQASREGDDIGVWLAMAARAENSRLLAKLRLEEKKDHPFDRDL